MVVQCSQDQAGNLTAQKMVANSLGDERGRAMRETLQNRSPCAAWTEGLHEKLGADFRELTLTVNFN